MTLRALKEKAAKVREDNRTSCSPTDRATGELLAAVEALDGGDVIVSGVALQRALSLANAAPVDAAAMRTLRDLLAGLAAR